MTHLKQRHHNQNTTSRKPKGQFLSPITPSPPPTHPPTPDNKKNGQTAIKKKNHQDMSMQRHTMTEIVNHSSSTVLERSTKNFLGWVDGWVGGGGGDGRGGGGGGLNRFYLATTLALSSAVVYTSHLFSPRELLACDSSSNIFLGTWEMLIHEKRSLYCRILGPSCTWVKLSL